ncbi:MAG: porin family protein [Elusimicrobiota bacterium]
MKKLLVIFVALFIVSSVIYAKEIKGGVKAGINIANWSGDDVEKEDKKSRVGIVAGGFVTIPLNDQFSLQPELLLSMKGVKYEGSFMGESYESTVKLTYIEIPVLAKLNIPSEGSVKPNVFLGPSIGMKASAKSEFVFGGVSEESDLEDVKSLDLGLAIGGGVDIDAGAGKVTLDARYTMGLTSINDSADDLDVKNSVIAIMAGYCF